MPWGGCLRSRQRYSGKSRTGGVTGFTFRHSDKADLESILRLLVSEPDIRKAAARKAKEKVRSHYQWGKVAREVESQYLALTGRDNVKKPAASVRTPDYRHRAA